MQREGGLRTTGGIPVIVESSPALPLVSVVVALRGGATWDPPGKEGLCRLAARLMRRTAGGRAAQELEEHVDDLGATFGADINHTTLSMTGTVIRRNLSPFLDLVSDAIARPGFAADELDRLKRETAAELVEARDNDSTLVRRWFRRKIFDDHPYTRPVSGTVLTTERITREDVVAYQRKAFVRSNAVFCFSGAIETEEALQAAEKLEAALADGPPQPDSVGEPTCPAGRRLLFVDKPDRSQTQILIGGLGTHPADPDHTALIVANTIFGGTFTARMTREIRSKRGWSYGAYSSLPYDRHRRPFSLWTFPKATDAAPCIELQLAMLQEWWNDGVTDDEVAWAKGYLTRSHAFAIDTAGKRAAQVLETELYGLAPDYHSGYLARLQAVTARSASDAVRQRVAPSNLLVAVVGTESDIGGAVRNSIDGLGTAELVRFDEDA